MKIAIYPGSFDPVTKGHLDILKNASEIFDKVIIAVAHNGEKKGFLTVEERVMLIKESIKDFNNVEVDAFEGLTIEYAKKHGAEVLIRGLRAVSDFEYEMQLSQTNRLAFSLGMVKPVLSSVSGTAFCKRCRIKFQPTLREPAFLLAPIQFLPLIILPFILTGLRISSAIQ